MNHSSQTLIFIVFVMACTLMFGIYFAFRNREAYSKKLLLGASIVWKQLHGFCVPAGVYFALLTFQVLASGFNFEAQLL
jgi:hypothetical protein